MSVRFEDLKLVEFHQVFKDGELTITGTRDGVTYGIKSAKFCNFNTGYQLVDDLNIWINAKVLRSIVQASFDKLDGFTVPRVVDMREDPDPSPEMARAFVESIRPALRCLRD